MPDLRISFTSENSGPDPGSPDLGRPGFFIEKKSGLKRLLVRRNANLSLLHEIVLALNPRDSSCRSGDPEIPGKLR